MNSNLNIELYIISNESRKAKRIIGFTQEQKRESTWGPVEISGTCEVEKWLNQDKDYRILAIDLNDGNKPYFQLNNTCLRYFPYSSFA